MEKCLQCSKELIHVPGRKQKSFCDVNCRNKYFYAQRKKQVEDAKALLVSLPADYVEVKNIGILTEDGGVNPIFPKPHKKPKNKALENIDTSERINEIAPPEVYDAPPFNLNDELLRKIESIKAEKIPKERDTPMGRKSWEMDKQKRIQEIKNQLNK